MTEVIYEQKDGQGVLFTNKNKKTDNHPDYSGNIKIDGREYWLAGWIKTSEKGLRISVAATLKENKAETAIKEVFGEKNAEPDDIGF